MSYVSYVKYKVAHSEFLHGFIASLSMIIVSEIGDKTFFIAAIMAMRHSRVVVLTGALGALVVMTFLSGNVMLFAIINHCMIGYLESPMINKFSIINKESSGRNL